MSEWDPVDSQDGDEWQPVQHSDEWQPVANKSSDWEPVKSSIVDIAKPYAEAMYNKTPMGYLNEHVVHPALTGAKQFIANRLPNEESIAPDFQSDSSIKRGLGYAKAATAATGDALLSQVPESSLGVGGALAAGKAIGAVGEYAPGLVGKAFPRVGKALASDVGGWAVEKMGSLSDWLDKRSARPADLAPAEPPPAAETESSAPPPAAIAPAATSESPPQGLPVMQGAPEGKPYALFDYNDPITGKSSYKIHGDAEALGYKTVPNVPFETLQEKGVPVIGKTSKAADLGHEPLDPIQPQSAAPQYDELQKSIDARVDELMAKGMSFKDADNDPSVMALYEKRDTLGQSDLEQSHAHLLERISASGISKTEANEILAKVYNIDPTSKAGQYMAAKYGQPLIDNPRQAAEEIAKHLIYGPNADTPAVTNDVLLESNLSPLTDLGKRNLLDSLKKKAKTIAEAVSAAHDEPRRLASPAPPAAPPPEPPPTGPVYPPSNYEPSAQTGKMDEFQRLMYDRFQPIKYKAGEEVAPEAGNAGGNYTEPYLKARTLQGRTMSQFSDAANELHDLYKPLKGAQDLQDFNDIYSSKNHLDLAREGRMTSGVTADEAQSRIDAIKQRLGPEDFARIDSTVENVAKWANDKGLGILEKAGKITPEAAARWRQQFPHYMPSEIMDDELMNGGQPSALGKIKQNFMKYKSGTDSLINENADQMIKKGLLNKISAVNKQDVIDSIANSFGKTIGQQTYRDGDVIRAYKADSQIPEGYVESSARTSDGRIIAVSKQVESLIQGLNKFQTDIATRAMANYNALFREGATAMRLSFSAGHFIRAAQSALMNTRPIDGATNAMRPLASAILSTAKDMIGMDDADMQAFRASGGAFGGIADPKSVPLPFRLQTLGQKALNVAAIPFKIPARLGRFSDQVIRLNEFKRLKPTDLPDMLKALNARDISIDFEKSGDLLKHINQWVPFINDKMQANVNTVRMFRDNPALAAARTSAFILAPTMGLYYWNHKFANDDQIDPYIRENYFYINTGKTTVNNGVRVPVVFTIPKKGIYQYLSNATSAMLDYKFNRQQFQQDVKSYGAGPQIRGIATEVTPPAGKLALEPIMNQSLYTGAPIVPESQQFVDPHMQANTGSSNTSRIIANKTGVPAQVVENMANNIFPAAHQFMGLTDKGLASAGVSPENPQPPHTVLQQAQPLQPFLRPASGHYSTEEANASDIVQKLKIAAGTPRFLAKQALQQYETDRTPQNLAAVDKWMGQLNGEDRQRVIESIYGKLNLQQQTPTDRAMARAPAKNRQQVYQGLRQ